MGESRGIDDLIEYAAGFDPSFPSRILGAAPGTVKRLAQLVELPLPDLWLGYLARMGSENRLDQAFCDASPRADDVLDYYEAARGAEKGQLLIPDGGIVVAVGGCACEQVSLIPGPGGEHELRFTDGDHVGERLASSLEKYLFSTVWEQLGRRARWGPGGWAGAQCTPARAAERGTVLADVRMAAEESGFRVLWFSDDEHLHAESEHAGLYASQLESHRGVVVTATTRSIGEAVNVARPFVERFGLDMEHTGELPGIAR